MSLLRAAATILERRRVPFALIGAGAMAVHGVGRSTQDTDLLVTDRGCLAATAWESLPPGARADIAAGDADDPLAGVVRLRAPGENPLDVVVGRHPWQAAVLGRAERVEIEGVAVPVARPADLILLKLYAGGPQDAWDVQQLLAAGDQTALGREVEDRLAALPPASARLWQRIRATEETT